MFVGFHALFLKIVLATLYYISIEYLNAYTIIVVTLKINAPNSFFQDEPKFFYIILDFSTSF